MIKISQNLKNLRDYFPTKIPFESPEELDKFTSDLFKSYDIPDTRSYRHAIATMIMHLGPTTTAIPKIFFVRSVRKAMANQLAYDKIKEINEADKIEALKKAEIAKSEILTNNIIAQDAIEN